jgi:serine/threonine-protein kinase
MLAPGSEIGRYVVRQRLAEGGMAEIFLASAVGPEGFAKDVVIKVVRRFLATDPQFVQMFIDEARLASRLNHANVVQIFDFGKHGDTYYLAMEYVRGVSLWDLRRRCREQGVPFPPTLAAEIGAQVARGLHYAHSLSENGQRLGVVHRDVTPHNVLLSFDGAVKLTDFGIAKAQRSQTVPGSLKGKFAYMSPEQSRGEAVDARTDLFALGIVLWELVTGGRLFDGDSDVAVLRAVQESLVPPASRLNPEVPAELSDLLAKALARPLAERFQTAAELEKALATFVLRSARSVEDTSVATFLQQLFPEEASGAGPSPGQTLTDHDAAFLVGPTFPSPRVAEVDPTMTVTPLVEPLQRRLTPTAVDAARSSGPTPALEPLSQRTTDEHDFGAERPKTAQMPALSPTSRRFDPIPVSAEPSVVVSRSMTSLPDVSGAATTERAATPEEPPLSAPRSPWPLVVVLAVVVGVLGVGVVTLGGDGPATPEPGPRPALADPAAARGAPEDAPAAAAVAATPPAPPAALGPEAAPVEDGALTGGAGAAEPAVPPGPTPGASASATTPVAGKAAGEPTAPGPGDDADAVTTKRPAPAPAPAKRPGTIAVRASPFATVTIKGRQYEVTGVKNLPAPAGTYDIVLAHPKKKVTERVSVQPGATTAVSFTVE